jgi:hypothetical protein
MRQSSRSGQPARAQRSAASTPTGTNGDELAGIQHHTTWLLRELKRPKDRLSEAISKRLRQLIAEGECRIEEARVNERRIACGIDDYQLSAPILALYAWLGNLRELVERHGAPVKRGRPSRPEVTIVARAALSLMQVAPDITQSDALNRVRSWARSAGHEIEQRAAREAFRSLPEYRLFKPRRAR